MWHDNCHWRATEIVTAMDQPLSKTYKRKKLVKSAGWISLIVIIPLLMLFFFRYAFTEEISLSKVDIASARRGDIQITVQGSGLVIPAYEETITGPFRSYVRKIVKSPGAKVSIGDTLLILDNKLAENDLDLLKNELDLKTIRIEKLRIELQQIKEDHAFRDAIKNISVLNLKLAFEAESTLNKMGGSPMYNVRKARSEWDIAKLESDQLKYNFKNEVDSRNNSIRELETEIRILKNKIISSKDLVDHAIVRAPFQGSLSWIIDKAGATVADGQEIARIADFSTYKLKGSASSAWLGKIATGQKVEVRNQGMSFSGTIENILPAVNLGMVEFIIRLDEGDISTLRPEQQVEVRVVTSFKQNVLMLPNGQYYTDRGYKDMYLIRDNKAYRTRVLLGEANFNNVEVVDGLAEGDKLILTDIGERFKNNEIRVIK